MSASTEERDRDDGTARERELQVEPSRRIRSAAGVYAVVPVARVMGHFDRPSSQPAVGEPPRSVNTSPLTKLESVLEAK